MGEPPSVEVDTSQGTADLYHLANQLDKAACRRCVDEQ
jgi:hypothetical protein